MWMLSSYELAIQRGNKEWDGNTMTRSDNATIFMSQQQTMINIMQQSEKKIPEICHEDGVIISK